LRLMKDEGVGTARCVNCAKHFLLLDSEDYWFDVIQAGYPRVTSCSCKDTTFKLQLDNRFRDDGDVEWIGVGTICARCGKSQRRMGIEIDYGPTEHLLKTPLTPCENPQLLFDLHELSLYATPADMAGVIDYLAGQGCSLAGQVRDGRDWTFRQLSSKEASALIAKRGTLPVFLFLYASLKPLKLSESAVSTAKKEAQLWKHKEVIRLAAPLSMVWGRREVPLYYLHYANEYVQDQSVKVKSAPFRRLTAGLVDCLSRQFVTWRGRDCFDNQRVHLQVFGSKYETRRTRRGTKNSKGR
jgi:hypothetical protein